MPTLSVRRSAGSSPPRIAVLGDLLLDVVLAPDGELQLGTDTPGSVALRQGGSAATTARWVARLGGRITFITAVGRDQVGRALIAALEADGVTVRAVRPTGQRTGRIGVLVAAGGERSFVADRGAADMLRSEEVRAEWLARIQLLHLPVYSLLPEPLGTAARHAAELVRAGGGVVTVDLASSGPIAQAGRRTTRARIEAVAPAILFTTVPEARALLAGAPIDELLGIAPVAVIKRGAHGVSLLARADEPGAGRLRFDVATRPLVAPDTTGAGDAFDAGFLVAWLRGAAEGLALPLRLQRSAAAGHRAATRQLTGARPEITFE